MSVGERIYHYRKQRNLSQQDLATKANVPISTISLMESGQRDGENMTLSVAKRLAYALDISLHTLAGFDIRKGKRHAAQDRSSHRASTTSEATSAA